MYYCCGEYNSSFSNNIVDELLRWWIANPLLFERVENPTNVVKLFHEWVRQYRVLKHYNEQPSCTGYLTRGQHRLTIQYQSIMSLAIYDRFGPLLIMQGWCMYLQVSWRPHTGSIGFRTKKYLDLNVHTVWTVRCCLQKSSTYIPRKGCKRHFSIRNAVRSTDRSACALDCLCIWLPVGRNHRSIGVHTWMSCILPVVLVLNA
jgi:hypothetical protein